MSTCIAKLAYAVVGSNNLEEAKKFYDRLLLSIGLTSVFEHPSGGRIYGRDGEISFGVLGPFDGSPASVGNGSMVGFSFESNHDVSEFYNLAIKLGALDDGPPGERAPGVFFAYFRDLDGNKICGYKITKDK